MRQDTIKNLGVEALEHRMEVSEEIRQTLLRGVAIKNEHWRNYLTVLIQNDQYDSNERIKDINRESERLAGAKHLKANEKLTNYVSYKFSLKDFECDYNFYDSRESGTWYDDRCVGIIRDHIAYCVYPMDDRTTDAFIERSSKKIEAEVDRLIKEFNNK